MKKWILYTMIGMLFVSCKKDQFDIESPNVGVFVQMLKSETYDAYELNEKGERLWLKMPRFRQGHIASLIELSKDTTHIKSFPTNPISSRTPRPQGRDYFILGECLLWIVEALRGGGSLDPYLIDASKEGVEKYKGVTSTEILMISDKYRQWWNSYKNGDWKGNDPLGSTSYRWM